MYLFRPNLIASAISLLLITFSVSATEHNLKASAVPDSQWWWLAPQTPSLTVEVSDSTGAACDADLRIVITTDNYAPVSEESRHLAIAAGDTARLQVNPGVTAPGFYRLSVSDGDKRLLDMNFGYEPENIVSLPDSQPDFDQFWADALEELAAVEPDYILEKVDSLCGEKRNVYLASMKSLGGDTISGYIAIPVKEGKYPVHIIYNGYGVDPWCVGADDAPDWIHFIPFARGQGYGKKYNKYGDWVAYGIASPETYYYRGAFMDVVRAIDFIYQLPQADRDNIFAEGGSQGGAFTLVSAALDDRVAAIAPYIPFLSDFPDYFNIVHWPAEPVKKAAAEAGISDTDMYKTLSYFDMKNMARRIKCPVLMGVGLQDPVCPPHTNFSGYNLINSPKEFIIYRDLGHTVDYDDWNPRIRAFFERNRR